MIPSDANRVAAPGCARLGDHAKSWRSVEPLGHDARFTVAAESCPDARGHRRKRIHRRRQNNRHAGRAAATAPIDNGTRRRIVLRLMWAVAGVRIVNITGRVRLHCPCMMHVSGGVPRAQSIAMERPMNGQRDNRQHCKACGDALDKGVVGTDHWVVARWRSSSYCFPAASSSAQTSLTFRIRLAARRTRVLSPVRSISFAR